MAHEKTRRGVCRAGSGRTVRAGGSASSLAIRHDPTNDRADHEREQDVEVAVVVGHGF